MPLPFEAELLAGLGALGNLHLGPAAVDGRHLEGPPSAAVVILRPARGSRGPGPRAGTGVRLDREEDVEIAGRAAAEAGLALAGEADAGAVLDAGGDVHLQHALLA
jgi:hypothetical protein